METYKKYLRSYSKYTNDDSLRVVWYTYVPLVGEFDKTDILSDVALISLANEKEKTTWDEDEICESLGLEYINSEIELL